MLVDTIQEPMVFNSLPAAAVSNIRLAARYNHTMPRCALARRTLNVFRIEDDTKNMNAGEAKTKH